MPRICLRRAYELPPLALATQIAKDGAAYFVNGTVANSAQALNAQLTSALWHCHSLMTKAESEYNERIMSILRGPIDVRPGLAFDSPQTSADHGLLSGLSSQRLVKVCTTHTTALLTAIKRDFSNIIGRLHKVDFSKLDDPVMGGTSPYMTTLMERLTFVRVELLTPYNVGKLKKDWCVKVE
jgi:hypothetical protein